MHIMSQYEKLRTAHPHTSAESWSSVVPNTSGSSKLVTSKSDQLRQPTEDLALGTNDLPGVDFQKTCNYGDTTEP